MQRPDRWPTRRRGGHDAGEFNMPTYLMTVQADDFQGGELKPQLRLRRFQQEEILQRLAPGRRVHLRCLDGGRQSTMLERVSVDGLTRVAYSSADDATFYS
jgi:hypothetical protein